MKISKILFGLLGLALALSVLSAPAQAQATRTWVSGVGDDANPCSRTAPCKTFAGAISKTATSGEINVLDPGGFGAVTITKSITISSENIEAGVLVSGTNAIVVSGAGINVVLRGLDIEGLGTGLVGINFINGASLHVEKCTIHGFSAGSAAGIQFSPNTNAKLFVKDSIFRENGNTAGSTGGGIIVNPASGGTALVTIENTYVHDNAFGIRANGTNGAVNMSIRNSSSSGNSVDGVVAVTTGAASTVIVDSSDIANNLNNGLNANGAAANITVSRSTVTGNGTAAAAPNGGTMLTTGDNNIFKNTNNALPGPTNHN